VSVSQQPWVMRRRHQAREFRDRHIDAQLRQLSRVRRQLLRGEVDVLVLGDSSCLFGAASDTDPAMIPELIGRELGGLRVASICGAGYAAKQHAEFLRILAMLPVRPLYLVTSVCVRTSTSVHVTTHPTYAYTESLEHLAAITSPKRRIRYLQRKPRTDSTAYDVFHARPVTTRWGGDSSIGEFRDRLKGHGAPPWDAAHERTLFDYFHGEVVTPETPGVADWEEFGRAVAAYGVPTVSFRTMAPLGRGEAHFPGEFEAHVRANQAVIDDAIRSTAGSAYEIVGGDLVEDDYADSRDATEHFALSGRLKVARAVASAFSSMSSRD
jgi:hypothetical protein